MSYNICRASFYFLLLIRGLKMENLMNSALSQGLGYAMFISLLFYVLKQQEKRDVKSEQREENYQKIISELSGKYSEIAKDVKEVKDYIFKKGDK